MIFLLVVHDLLLRSHFRLSVRM